MEGKKKKKTFLTFWIFLRLSSVYLINIITSSFLYLIPETRMEQLLQSGYLVGTERAPVNKYRTCP